MEKNKKYYPLILWVLIGIVLGIILGFIIIFFEMDPSFSSIEVSLVLIVASLFISLPIHVAIHEAGHGIFGFLSGYSFISYRIFDFHFQKEKGRLRRRKVHIPGTLGQCIMEPKESWDKVGGIAYLLGGGLSNLLFALVLFVLSLKLKQKMGWELFLGFSIMGIYLGFSNLLPLTIQGIGTDGKNIQYLLQSPDNRRALWIQLKVTAELSKGKKWEDLPEGYFFDFQNHYNQSNLIQQAGILASSFWLNQNQLFKSEKILNEIGEEKDNLVGMARIIYYMAKLEFLRYKEDWETYSQLYKEIKKDLKPIENTEDGIYARYIYYRYGIEEVERATGLWEEFLKESKTSPFQGIINDLIKEEEKRRDSVSKELGVSSNV